MIRLITKIGYAILMLFVLCISIASFFLSTTPGLYTAIQLTKPYLPGTLRVHHLSGRLLDSFSIETLEYTYRDTHITLQHVKLKWDLGALLLHPQLPITPLQVTWKDLHWESGPSKNLNSARGSLSVTGTLPDLNLELTTTMNPQANIHWNLIAKAQGRLPWKWDIDATLTPPNASSNQAGLYTNITVKAHILDTDTGTLSLKINPGHYQLPKDSMLTSVTFQKGTVDAVLSPSGLSGKGALTIEDNTQLNLQFTLPHYSLQKAFSLNQPLKANLSLALNTLEFLQETNPELKHLKGQLQAHIQALGTLGQPRIESVLTLSNASCELPNLGITLHDIDLSVQSKKQHWEANGSISSGNKILSLKGQGPLTKEMSGLIRINGSEIPIIKTKEYTINLSPDLNLNFSPSGVHISGTIQVPYAKITLQSLTNSLTLSDDVVFENKKELQPEELFTSMDIRVEMGKEVELTLKGLHARVEGAVNLKQIPKAPINAFGELRVKKGEYKAYGQDLAIDQGQLLFNGGSLDNPGINLRASKTINNEASNTPGSNQLFDFNSSNLQTTNLGANTTVGVEVTGHLSAPKIQLFSNPAVLSQADILSMLVLGRPANQANKAGGQLLLAAISSMNLGTSSNGTQLLEQLKQNLGFDFNVQTNSNYNQSTNQFTDSTAFVVSKSLSKRLYLSYNIGLSQADPNVMTLKYLLNKFLSIQVSSSLTANGIDFLYTRRSKDKPHEHL
ncbi:MAG: translocation/assembly module TamB domain-containing protein [Legionellales bacterium]